MNILAAACFLFWGCFVDLMILDTVMKKGIWAIFAYVFASIAMGFFAGIFSIKGGRS